MKCEAYLQSLWEQYRLISVLSNKNGARVMRLRHKTLEKDLIA